MSKITFKFKLALVDGMRATTFRIDSERLSEDDLEIMRSPTDTNVIEGEISIEPILSTVVISVWGVGKPNLVGSFNITYKNKKFFDVDEKLVVNSGARFRFYKTQIKIPY
ncbi:hypothetical protein [Catalinimonas alkaloidigena]|uniref:hypothetical protein n=1 Tax=Catalinimonas alkaloidigena TaxID=1075417 RepID=UPI00115F8B07|nr:hypothetical protein [Catalinimonas alkaloidigena]